MRRRRRGRNVVGRRSNAVRRRRGKPVRKKRGGGEIEGE